MAGIRDFARSLSSAGGQEIASAGQRVAGQSGALGSFMEKMTEHSTAYKEALQKVTDAQNELRHAEDEALRTKKELDQVEQQREKLAKKIHKTEWRLAEAKKKGAANTKALTDRLKKLQATSKDLDGTQKDLNKAYKKNNAAMDDLKKGYEEATEEMDKMNSQGGILSSTLGLLQNKAVLLGVAMAGLKANIDATDQASKVMSSTMLRFQENISGHSGFLGSIKDVSVEAFALRGQVTSFTREMTELGVSGDQAVATYQQISKVFRDNQGSVEANMEEIMDLTKQTHMLASALRIDASDALQIATNLVDRYGMSNRGARDALAYLRTEVIETNKQMENVHLRVEDVTRGVQRAAENTQGFTLNMRFLGNTMTQVAAQAQDQGATYAESLQIAESLTNLISGQKAPEWAEWRAGGKIIKEFQANLESMSGDAEAATEKILEKHGEGMDEKQKEHFRKNTEAFLKEMGSMNEKVRRESAMSLMRQTDMGRDAMLDTIRDMASQAGDPGIQTKLIQDWLGIDDTMTANRVRRMIVDEGLDFDEMGKDVQEAIEGSGKEQLSPMQKLESTVGKQLAILDGTAEKGITQVIRDHLTAVKNEILTSNTFLAVIAGAAGLQAIGGARGLMGAAGGAGRGAAGATRFGRQASRGFMGAGNAAAKGGRLARFGGAASKVAGRLGPLALAVGGISGIAGASRAEGGIGNKSAAFGDKFLGTFGLEGAGRWARGQAEGAGNRLMDRQLSGDRSGLEKFGTAVATGGISLIGEHAANKEKSIVEDARKQGAPDQWSNLQLRFHALLAQVKAGITSPQEAMSEFNHEVKVRSDWLKYIDGSTQEIAGMRELLEDTARTDSSSDVLKSIRDAFRAKHGRDMTRKEELKQIESFNRERGDMGLSEIDFSGDVKTEEQDRALRQRRARGSAKKLAGLSRFSFLSGATETMAEAAASGIEGVETEDIINLIKKEEENKDAERKDQKKLFGDALPEEWGEMTKKIRSDLSNMMAMNTMSQLSDEELEQRVRRGEFVETGALRHAATQRVGEKAVQAGARARGAQHQFQVTGDGLIVTETKIKSNIEGVDNNGGLG